MQFCWLLHKLSGFLEKPIERNQIFFYIFENGQYGSYQKRCEQNSEHRMKASKSVFFSVRNI